MAVILAAGRGERLAPITRGRPKALVEVASGLTLLELAIRSLRAAGLEELVVVSGYMGHKIEEALAGQEGIRIVRNPEYWRENGFSLLKASEAVGSEEFVLTMADHLFEPSIPRAAASAGPLALCVDREPRYLLSVEEATKVELAPDGSIRAIGKHLGRWDACDTGVFVCDERMLWAARELARQSFSITVSDCVRFLISRGYTFRTVDVSGSLWTDVDTPEALAHAKEKVLPGLLRAFGT